MGRGKLNVGTHLSELPRLEAVVRRRLLDLPGLYNVRAVGPAQGAGQGPVPKVHQAHGVLGPLREAPKD